MRTLLIVQDYRVLVCSFAAGGIDCRVMRTLRRPTEAVRTSHVAVFFSGVPLLPAAAAQTVGGCSLQGGRTEAWLQR